VIIDVETVIGVATHSNYMGIVHERSVLLTMRLTTPGDVCVLIMYVRACVRCPYRVAKREANEEIEIVPEKASHCMRAASGMRIAKCRS
jgi:hypothetical protein